MIARNHLVALSFASGTMLGLTLCGSSILRRSETVAREGEFQRLTGERTACVRQQIDSTLHAASSVGLALGSPECSSSSDFASVSATVLREHPEILALGWTRDLQNGETLPLVEVQERDGLPDLHQLDLRGSPAWAHAVDQCVSRHAPTFAPLDARDPAILLERRWLFVPVEATGEGSNTAPPGFVAALIDMGKCVEESRHGADATPAGLDMYLMETGEHVIGGRIHAHPSGSREKHDSEMPQPEQMFRGLHQVEIVAFGGRRWALLYAPAPILEASKPAAGSRLLMANGIVCALVCVGSGLAAGWFSRSPRGLARVISDGPSST